MPVSIWPFLAFPAEGREQDAAIVLWKFSFNFLLPSSLVSKLLVEGEFDPFNVMAKFNGWAKFQIHAFLNSGKSK